MKDLSVNNNDNNNEKKYFYVNYGNNPIPYNNKLTNNVDNLQSPIPIIIN